MQRTYVNDRPIIGQRAIIVDKDGSLRKEMWQAVAKQRSTFRDMLSGARLGHDKPPQYELMLHETKARIFHDFNQTIRKRKGPKLLGQSGDGSVGGWTVSTGSISSSIGSSMCSSSGTVGKRRSERLPGNTKGKRRCEGGIVKTKGKPYPVRLKPASYSDDPMEGPAPREETEGKSNFSNSPGSNTRSNKVSTPIDNTTSWRSSISASEPSTRASRDIRDASPALEIRVSRVGRQLSDPFRSSPEPTGLFCSPGTPTPGERLHAPLEQARPWSPRQNTAQPAQEHLTLSHRIQQAVDRGMADLETRLARLEECAAPFREVDLEARLTANFEAMLADRDVQIERLRAELDAEKLWRTT